MMKMKKIGYLPLLALLLLALLTGCGNGAGSPPAAEPEGERASDAFYLAITNDCDDELYDLGYAYFLGDIPVSSGGVINADNTAIEQGETLWLELLTGDFPEGAELTSFTFELTVVGTDGSESPVGEPVTLAAAYGETYEYTLTGSAAQGYTLIAN